jgi:hypothetical protein
MEYHNTHTLWCVVKLRAMTANIDRNPMLHWACANDGTTRIEMDPSLILY